MSTNGFKPKSNKKIKVNKNLNITLDGKHNEYMETFHRDETENIPDYQKQKKMLITEYNTKPMSIDEQLSVKDKIRDLNDKIKKLRIKKKDYLLTNSKHVFDYFETKKNISKMEGTTGQKNNKVNAFFKIHKDEEPVENNSHNIVNKYLSNVDESFIDMNSYVHETSVCQYCHKGELIPLEDEGVLICNECSRNIPCLIENEKPSYKEPPKEVCFYAYKRINHFKEIVSQFQGKETTQIPPEVIENIKLQIKKERIDMSQISNIKTKEILKKLGYNKYYEHIPFIKDKLGIKPPVMSPEFEETLFNLFMELQSPYSKFCPNDRVNFLNYYYTAYKLCELLGEDQYLEHFPMLKDREKRIEQDNIWRKICEELNWEFIPTI